MHTGDLLVEMLCAYGVEHVFGLISAHWPLYEAIHRRPHQIRHILVRDERNAAYAADGYARVSGKIGVCDATLGPGAIKLVSGLVEAYNSSIPVLSIADDLPLEWVHLADRGCAAQGMDQLRILESVAKWSALAPNQERLPELLRLALAQATSGRPGPAVLSIPVNLLTQAWAPGSPASWARPAHGRFPSSRAYPAPDDVERAAALLSQAQRPLILAGGGVQVSGAQAPLRALAEAAGIPVATTVSGKGALAENSPLSAGVAGSQYGDPCANALLAEADLVLLVGCKCSQRTFDWGAPAGQQRFLHLDVDPAEIGKLYPVEVGLVADARAGLECLVAALADRPQAERSRWLRRLHDARQGWRTQLAAEMARSGRPIPPQWVMGQLRRLLGPDDVVVTDASFSIGWAVSYLESQRDGAKFLFPRGAAGLGFSLGAAMGARLAQPQGQVVAITGDGGFGYCLMELCTLRKYDLNVKVVLLNNSALSYNRLATRLRGDEDFQSVTFPDINYAQVAQGFGVAGLRVEEPGALPGALRTAWETPGPALLDIVTDGWQTPELKLREALERLQGQERQAA
ncbi:MAG: thiamine pyrophosphate-binding protein [Chloroflexi bacterium]|nr:thiamine pyrophosphate-binding protein [Chloroflexota bacterium]